MRVNLKKWYNLVLIIGLCASPFIALFVELGNISLK